MTSRVRTMQQQDVDCVHAIEVLAHRAPWSRQILSDCVLVGYDCRVLELEENNVFSIAGYVISRYRDGMCHVLNLCVAPPLQNRGYGKQLLQAVMSQPLEDMECLYLEVRPTNIAALQLYKKMGFVQIGVKEAYYKDENGIEDAILLQLNLKM